MELIIFLALAVLAIALAATAVKIVSQSEVYVVERLGKYTKTLSAGMNLLVPVLDSVKRKVTILERQLDEFTISVITKDNVEVGLNSTVFYRVTDAAKSVYRISNVDRAIKTAAESIVRSASGKLDLDELQTSREKMGLEIATYLQEAAEVWGIEITRTEITDVQVDEQTKDAQRQQLNAEREKRASIARAEGEKKRIELEADARLYEAEKSAAAVRIEAAAQAFATQTVAEAITSNNGQAAIDFEIKKQQVQAIAELASSENTKTIILPTDVTKTLGSLAGVMEMISKK